MGHDCGHVPLTFCPIYDILVPYAARTITRGFTEVDMKNKTVKAAAAALLSVLILTALFGCGQRSGAKIYASSRAELMKALAEGHEKIYVGDIEFEENDLYIEIRRGVEIIGKPGAVRKRSRRRSCRREVRDRS